MERIECDGIATLSSNKQVGLVQQHKSHQAELGVSDITVILRRYFISTIRGGAAFLHHDLNMYQSMGSQLQIEPAAENNNIARLIALGIRNN